MSLAQRITNHRALLVLTAALCAGALGVSGCGGSSAPAAKSASASSGTVVKKDRVTTGKERPTAAPTPSQSSPDIGGARAQKVTRGSHKDARASGGVKSASDVSSGTSPAHAQHVSRVGKAGGTKRARNVQLVNDDHTPSSGSQQLNPCTLVSLTQAQSFTGGAVVGRIEAPQGPTCIYRSGKTSQITLAVESMDSAQVTRHMAQREEVTVGGRRGYCGHLGTQQLVVPLPGGQTLAVSAPCTVARQFASAALSRLTA